MTVAVSGATGLVWEVIAVQGDLLRGQEAPGT